MPGYQPPDAFTHGGPDQFVQAAMGQPAFRPPQNDYGVTGEHHIQFQGAPGPPMAPGGSPAPSYAIQPGTLQAHGGSAPRAPM